MTPDELIGAWKAEAELLRELFAAQPMIAGWGVHHTEAFSKFKRAGMALEKFRAYEVTLHMRGIRHSDDVEDLGFYADAFYYFAWRFVCLLRLVKARRANAETYRPFAQFSPAGVRRARNHLLEHTEKSGGVPDLASQFFSPAGWVMALQAVDGTGQPIDPGLYPNAEELLTDLSRSIRQATMAGRVGDEGQVRPTP